MRAIFSTPHMDGHGKKRRVLENAFIKHKTLREGDSFDN
jgi:hypothetical protein